ncbi:MAG: transcriptional repressor [Proteobacteria bacterium]|nr:transcriptional repressor [Pseudomonadota bacterium]
MTKARRKVLTILQEATEPLSVSSIVQHPSVDFNQATVYRSLHYLEQHGYLDSFILHCTDHGTERYYSCHSEGEHHKHWFHCTACHRFTDLGSCFLHEHLQEWESDYGFSVTDHTFFLTGVCQSCKSATASKD